VENIRSKGALLVVIVNDKTDNIMTSVNSVRRFETIQRMRSEILLRKNSCGAYIAKTCLSLS
jgi:hypothetical protein